MNTPTYWSCERGTTLTATATELKKGDVIDTDSFLPPALRLPGRRNTAGAQVGVAVTEGEETDKSRAVIALGEKTFQPGKLHIFY